MKNILISLIVSAVLVVASASRAATSFTVTNHATLTTAMTNARAGDCVLISPGTYASSLLAPDSSGDAIRGCIRILGDTTNCDIYRNTKPAVIFVGDTALTIRKDYINLRGFYLKTRSAITKTPLLELNKASYDSIASFVVDSGTVWVRGEDAALCDTSTTCFRDVIQKGLFNVGKACAAGEQWAYKLRNAVECEFIRVRVVGARTYAASDAARGRYLYYSRRNRFTDTRFDLDPQSAQTGECNGTQWRDFSSFNVHTRDTVWIGLNSKRSNFDAMLCSSGNLCTQGTSRGNQWINCDYRNYDHGFYASDTLVGAVMQNSVFASYSAGCTMLVQWCRGSTIRGCTFFTNGAIALAFSEKTPEQSLVVGNVFVSRPYPGGCGTVTWSSRGACLMYKAAVPFGSDSNFFAPATLTKAMGETADKTCRTLSEFQSRMGLLGERGSMARVFSGGMFVDARWSTLDLRPSAHSPLYNSAAPGGHYGALAKP